MKQSVATELTSKKCVPPFTPQKQPEVPLKVQNPGCPDRN
jgi:hypothetical protein